MANFSTQSDLVVQTITANKALASASYYEAKEAFDNLVAIITDLPATVVVPDIGTQAVTPWSATVVPEEIAFNTEAIDDSIAALSSVLSGSLLLPASYWDTVWAGVSGDLARQLVAALRNARNRGAASYWQLPSEAVLVSSRKLQDEALKSLQSARFQQAVQQAIMAREDYWKAIQSIVENTIKKISAQAEVRKTFLSENLGLLEIEKQQNSVEIDKAKLDQSAQETEVQLTITQAQWLSGLMAKLKQSAAELSYGYAQAAIASAHVGLSSGTSLGQSYGISASQNAELSWSFSFT